MSGPEGTIKFPEEWFTAPWDKCELLQVLTITRTGKQMFYAGGTLGDGSCLYGLTFPGGERVLRISPHTEWSVEERFKGRPPRADRATVDRIWRAIVNSLIQSKAMAEAELGPPPERDR